jgi:hypothetical protein
MPLDDNKAIIRSYVETVWNQGAAGSAHPDAAARRSPSSLRARGPDGRVVGVQLR